MSLEIRLLGELVVARDGRPLPLPASKKTRALLAYLAATGRPQLREKLCTLLWDGPDDPRAALRWSLTKLRPLVDEAGATRLVADRERVELVPAGATIDVVAMRAAIPGGLAGVARASTEALRQAAMFVRGELLEGLELPDCYRYDEWYRGERETMRRLGVGVLAALIERLRGGAPEEALDYARRWLVLDPLDEAAHGAVIRVLVELGRSAEALAQYASCARLFERELGRSPSRELERLRIAIASSPAPASAPPEPTPEVVTPDAPLIGRVQERAALVQLVETAQRGRLVLLLGDPGIGKTRLLDELVKVAREQGLEVLRGRGVEAEQVRPYGAWLDALAGVAEHPFRSVGSETDRARLFETVAEWLVARDRLCVIIDDLQWIDEASAALLHYIARSDAPSLRIACGARPGELADNLPALRMVRGLTRERAIHQIGLSPLDAEETRALALAHSPGVDGARVFAESGGHPLFAVEIARALARGETVWSSLDALLADRLEQLAGTARDILPWAAALGTAFSADVLATISGFPLAELGRAMAELERRAIVCARDTEWDFVHDLVRAAAYHAVSAPRRRLLHLQIARALAALADSEGERADAIAHHASLGDDHLLCANACVTAANRALRMFAPEEAAALTERGLNHAARLTGGERARLQVDLLTLALHADTHGHRRAATVRAFQRAIVDAQAAGCHADAVRGMSEMSWASFRTNKFDEALSLSQDAARRARETDPETRARTLAYSAHCVAMVGRHMGEAEQLAQEAAALVADQNLELASLSFALALIRHHQGDDAAALTLFRRTIDLGEREGTWWLVALCLAESASIELACGHPREALDLCIALRETGGRAGDSAHVPMGAVLEAIARRSLGEPVEIEPALPELRAADAPALLARVLVLSCEVELALGRLEAAAAHAREAVAVALRSQRDSEIMLARCVAARIADALGEDAAEQRRALASIDCALVSAGARAAYAAVM